MDEWWVSNSLDRLLRSIDCPNWEVRVVGSRAAFYVPANRWPAVESALGDAGIALLESCTFGGNGEAVVLGEVSLRDAGDAQRVLDDVVLGEDPGEA